MNFTQGQKFHKDFGCNIRSTLICVHQKYKPQLWPLDSPLERLGKRKCKPVNLCYNLV